MISGKLGAEVELDEKGGVGIFTFPRLAEPDVLRHVISTRVGGISGGTYGALNMSYKVGDDPVVVSENRELLSKAIGMDLDRVVQVDQIHSDQVLILGDGDSAAEGGSLGEGDGLITRERGVPIMILVADCLPVLFFDPKNQAIGLAHAGWRGTVNHVAAKTLLAMGEAFGTKPEEVRSALGPCIGPCCYEVGEDVKDEFSAVFPWAEEVLRRHSPNRWKLDLAEANARQLLEIGVKEENLIRSGLCTVKNIDLFYSHRVEASPFAKASGDGSLGKSTGRFGAIMMLPKS
jgi:polyphenol oxidase